MCEVIVLFMNISTETSCDKFQKLLKVVGCQYLNVGYHTHRRRHCNSHRRRSIFKASHKRAEKGMNNQTHAHDRSTSQNKYSPLRR